MENKKISTFVAISIAFLAVITDVLAHVPGFSLILMAIGLIGGARRLFNKRGILLKKDFFQIFPNVFILALPASIFLGVLCSEIASFKAKKIKNSIVEKSKTENIQKAYAEICWKDGRKECGFLTYKILLYDGGTIEKSHLIVMQYFEKRTQMNIK